jgi:ribose/xylose/arabinose/galactoside ABC-type transport system permease subunit
MGKHIKKILHSKTFSLIALTVVLGAILYMYNHGFLAKGNIRGMMNNMCVQGIMLACGAMLLMSGNIDLSTGSIAALGSMLFAQLLVSFPGLPWPIAIVITLVFGACLGLINVFFMNVMNLMPFIVTIGMSSVYSGIAVLWTKGNNISINVASFTNLNKVALFDIIPLFFIIMVVIVLIHGFVLSNTQFGRSVYMIGGNPYAARLSGLNPKKIRAKLYVINSTVATFAGIIWVAQKKMASASNMITAAPNMTALTATILGGVSFMGGSGGMAGAFAGMLLLNVFTFGLTILKIPTFINIAMQGLLLIVALILDNINAMRVSRGLKAAAIKNEKKAA